MYQKNYKRFVISQFFFYKPEIFSAVNVVRSKEQNGKRLFARAPEAERGAVSVRRDK